LQACAGKAGYDWTVNTTTITIFDSLKTYSKKCGFSASTVQLTDPTLDADGDSEGIYVY
jgi:hypothetical protein